jgi:Ulp1 family protease
MLVLPKRQQWVASVQGEAAKYERVRKWTKNVDIFAKDYIFVPIHDHAHWSLAVICHPGVLPCVHQHTSMQSVSQLLLLE